MSGVTTLEQARLAESSYQPNADVANGLKDKSLIMFVGPVASGKTFIMNNVVHTDTSFGRVPVFTTRDPRADDDPGMFRAMPHDEAHIEEILEKINDGDVVQYAVHPTSDRFYGSEPSDYPKPYNMLATLSGVVDSMSQLPFKNTFIIGIVCEPATWKEWLTKRYPSSTKEKQKRIKEAVQSLEWLLESNRDIIWIENSRSEPQKTTRDVIDAVLYNKRNDGAKQLASDMLREAKGML